MVNFLGGDILYYLSGEKSSISKSVRCVRNTQDRKLSVTVSSSSTGGTVNELTPGNDINLCTGSTGDCEGLYAYGTAVTLQAIPNIGLTFISWVGGGCSRTTIDCVVTLNEHTEVTGIFEEETPGKNVLTVTKSGQGSGSIGAAPTGTLVQCDGNYCTARYDENETITLTANPSAGSEFRSWSVAEGGHCPDGKNPTCILTMETSNITVEAIFDIIDTTPPVEKTLYVTPFGPGTGTITETIAGQEEVFARHYIVMGQL